MTTTFGGDVLVGGNIAVGGFVVSGTLSAGTATVPNLTLTNSLTIGDVVVQEVGTTLDFSGPTITGLTLCGAAVGGGVPDPLTISNLNVTVSAVIPDIAGLSQLNSVAVIVDTTSNVVAIGPNVLGGATTYANGVMFGINAGSNNAGTNVVAIGVGAGTGNTGSNCIFLGDGGVDTANTDANRFRVHSGFVGVAPLLLGDLANSQLAIGTTTLSGALNVSGAATISGDLYLSAVRQPVVQFGRAGIAATDTSVSVVLGTPYIDTSYAVQVTGADSSIETRVWATAADTSSFGIFIVNPAASDLSLHWTTFGYLF